jgi:hypothetical protein
MFNISQRILLIMASQDCNLEIIINKNADGLPREFTTLNMCDISLLVKSIF